MTNLSEDQLATHWDRWRDVRRAHGWHGRSVGSLDWVARADGAPLPRHRFHRRLHELAHVLRPEPSALALGVDELRHAAYVLATGPLNPVTSLLELRPATLERVLNLFDLLIDPADEAALRLRERFEAHNSGQQVLSLDEVDDRDWDDALDETAAGLAIGTPILLHHRRWRRHGRFALAA